MEFLSKSTIFVRKDNSSNDKMKKMKKPLLVLVVSLLMVACGGQAKKVKLKTKSGVETKATTQVYTIESLLLEASTLADKEVTVRGTITHTCKFSGKRCFLMGADQKTTLRVEAKGDIGGFNRELIGSELAITGILRESRLTKEYIDRWEEEVKESQGKEDGSVESCDAETDNIQSMKEWMKKNNQDYFSTYFMDGESFEVIE